MRPFILRGGRPFALRLPVVPGTLRPLYMANEPSAFLTRKDLARRLQVGPRTVERLERRYPALAAARVTVTARTVRYSTGALKRVPWWRD